MTEQTIITEKALLHRLECPLRPTGSDSGQESPVLRCAERTMQWTIAEVARGRLPDVLETHQHYFEADPDFFQSGQLPAKEYDHRLKEGWRVCRLLRDLLFRCEILQPVERYAVSIGGVSITGEYCILRSSRRKREAFGLYLRQGGLKVRPLIPDVVSFARFVDASTRLASRGWGVDRIGVLHYWVNQKLHQPDLEFAGNVLRGATGSLFLPLYPIVGEHCRSCTSRRCTTDGRDNGLLHGEASVPPGIEESAPPVRMAISLPQPLTPPAAIIEVIAACRQPANDLIQILKTMISLATAKEFQLVQMVDKTGASAPMAAKSFQPIGSMAPKEATLGELLVERSVSSL